MYQQKQPLPLTIPTLPLGTSRAGACGRCGRWQQILIIKQIEVQMSLNALRNRQPSLQQSRVSSSSSNQSQSYELIPTHEPFFNPARDTASPKASFPFRRVQAGTESSLNNRSHNESRSSIKGSVRDVNQSRDLIEVIGQLNASRKREGREVEEALQGQHTQCKSRMEELGRKIEQLQRNLEQERNEYDLQRKANEIYTEGFGRIRGIIVSRCSNFEGESIEEMVEKLAEIVEARPANEGVVEDMERKISELRTELLKSTQNNINAIFNTQISEAYCLQHQVQKMNLEIAALKEKLMRASVESQDNMNRLLQNRSNAAEIKKIIKIYQQRDSESDGEEREERTRARKKTSKNKLKESRESSSSDKSSRKKRASHTENHVKQLIEGYKYLQGEFAKLDGTIRQINGSQSDFKDLFFNLKKDITVSIETQIKEVKETVKRPSSNTQQKKMAKEIWAKLNDLSNTLNAPEKASLERSLSEDENMNWRNVESVRRIAELESKNRKLQEEVKILGEERRRLQDKIMNLSKHYSSKNREYGHNQLCVESVEERMKKSKKGEFYDQFLRTSRSDMRQQHINEQLSAGEGNGPVVHSSGFNKLHSSQSEHQSSSKHAQIQNLYLKLQRCQEHLRDRQMRITQLQNTIMDHLQPRSNIHNRSEQEIRERYEQYINNLKILLTESRNEYEVLKKELIKSNEMSLSRANDQDRNSITLSDRTTKNRISQTRLIQRRSPKTNTFETAKAKIQLQMALENLFVPLLQFAEKVITHQQLSVLQAVLGCLRELIVQAKERDYKIYEQTMTKEQVVRRLRAIGIDLN